MKSVVVATTLKRLHTTTAYLIPAQRHLHIFRRVIVNKNTQLLTNILRPIILLNSTRASATTSDVVVTDDGNSIVTQPESDEENTYEQLCSLTNELVRLDRLYYEKGKSEVSDDEYDSLCRKEEEILRLHPKFAKRLEDEGKQSRTSRVGAPISTSSTENSTKRAHLSPLMSLDNVHSTDDIIKWLRRVRKKLLDMECTSIITEPKLDGLSVSLRYESGELIWAATRGDGRVGIDVTAAAIQYISSLPLNLSSVSKNVSLEVRGEVVMPKSSFLRWHHQQATISTDENASTAPTVSNSRNAAAGMLLRKQLSNSTLFNAQLQFYAYDVVVVDKISMETQPWWNNGIEMRQWLQEAGFCVPVPMTITPITLLSTSSTDANETTDSNWIPSNIQPLLDYSNRLQDYRQGSSSSSSSSSNMVNGDNSWGDYEMDGCVHKVSEFSAREVLGTTSRAPRWAVAHKLIPNVAVTRLLDVSVQVGRTGALTPVAVLEPVSIDGVIVQRATLHNFQHLQKLLGLGGRGKLQQLSIRKGSLVKVHRSGDVIPQVVSLVVESPDTTFDFSVNGSISLATPTNCPACGSAVVVESIRSSGSTTTPAQVVRCGGPVLLCPPRAVSTLQHAYSRDALDIAGLSEARIRQLMDSGFLRVPSDLFRILKDDSQLEKLMSLEGWGPQSVKKLKAATDLIVERGISFSRFLFALGIRYVGAQTASLIANAYGSVAAFWAEVDQVTEDLNFNSSSSTTAFPTLCQDNDANKGIGPAVLSALISFAKDKQLARAGKELSSILRVHSMSLATEAQADLQGDQKSGRLWRGQNVVFTGTLPDSISRSDAQKWAKEVLGARSTPSSITQSTNWVVVGENSGKKKTQAERLGIQTITAQDFLDLVSQMRKSE